MRCLKEAQSYIPTSSLGSFTEIPPSYGKIWGVLNYLWGKDRKVTIHNLSANAFLFHIPSVSLRRKVLQHELWRVGDSPFFVTEWKAAFSFDPPSLQKAPDWVKINNIPFDLITDEGMSYIARPLGKVVDKKPFTSINSAEIKVIVNLTSTLPQTMEIERDDGQFVLLSFTYPWLPPLCSVRNEFGHKAAFCPTVKKPNHPKVKYPSSGQTVQEKAAPRKRETVNKEAPVWVEKQKQAQGSQNAVVVQPSDTSVQLNPEKQPISEEERASKIPEIGSKEVVIQGPAKDKEHVAEANPIDAA